MTSPRLPDFFIIGHPKSGTTALYEMLRQHPQIYLPKAKEPRFFASDLPSSFQRSSDVAPLTYEDYLALFSDARDDQRAGDASTAYIWSQTAAQLIAEAQPRARIIAILREPASFLRSMHLQLLQVRIESEPSLRKAIALEDARRQGRALTRTVERWPQVLLYTDRVRYVEQLRRYHALFGHKQVLVLIYDDFRADNDAVLRRVLRFLEVDEQAQIEMLRANPTVRVRSARLEDAVSAANLGQGSLARAVKTTARIAMPSKRLREEAFSLVRRRVVLAKPPPEDESFTQELRQRFKGEVQALSEYMDRDLVALWGYDKLS
jgi:hypothetical protein